LSVMERGRPYVTLKLATSLDGCIAMASGESRWITGEAARAHGHLERALADAILVGRGTFEADHPRLDVRLAGLEDRSPDRLLLSATALGSREPEDGIRILNRPEDIKKLIGIQTILIEGGAETASSFLRAGLVDRILLYRAPIFVGGGKACLTDIGLTSLAQAHGTWTLVDSRPLGKDRLEVYEATQH
jgi:diaminohydroxyphosphoribosylaminopyrimidine deaminase / 5-amino-6-(5-phosphoribosylamino)uracil reductase